MEWKRKTAMKEGKQAKVVCFRCKEEGHWARDCVAGHTDNLMPSGMLDGDGEDEGDFPSLEQAADMAREVIQQKDPGLKNL